MDIEEERKAFEAEIPGDLEHVNKAVNRSFVGDLDSLEKAFFEVWLAAKARAEEMVKPTVKITLKSDQSEFSSYPWVMALYEGDSFNGVLEDFHTQADAEQWAKDNGYRVVSE